MTTDDEGRPSWAVDLITQVAILNEKIPNHIDWVERQIRDHEERLRTSERVRVTKTELAQSLEPVHIELDAQEKRIALLERDRDTNSWLPKLGWTVLGAVGAGLVLTVLALIVPGFHTL